MTYVLKTYSMKKYAETASGVTDSALESMQRLKDETVRLKDKYSGTYLETQRQDLYEQITTIKAAAIKNIDDSLSAEIAKIRLPMTSMKPEDVVQNDLAMLNSDIFPVDQGIFDTLVEKYKGNFPMLQALCSYAEKHKNTDLTPLDTPKDGYINFTFPMTMDGAEKMASDIASICKSALDNPQSLGYLLSTSAGNIAKAIAMG